MSVNIFENDKRMEDLLVEAAGRQPTRPSKTRLADCIVRRALLLSDEELNTWLMETRDE